MPTDKEKGALGNSDAVATIAVKDIEVAKRFYEGKLGLKLVASEGPQVLTYKAGSSRVLVYASQYAGSNKATSATWLVGDELDKVVQALKGKGVAFLSTTTCPIRLAKATCTFRARQGSHGSKTRTATSSV